jgi:hypothetical protein
MRPTANTAFAASHSSSRQVPGSLAELPEPDRQDRRAVSPGGGVDVAARVIAPRLSEMLGQSVNRSSLAPPSAEKFDLFFTSEGLAMDIGGNFRNAEID